ncbi:MAG: rhodanese-like domain-containing protein [Eubacteriales bacterium]|jgi:phage shock protein E
MSFLNLFSRGSSLKAGLQQAQSTPGAILLDVRTPEEYEQGHLPGSLNLPLAEIHTISLPTEQPLFVYCLSGGRSAQACSHLRKRGYTATNIGGLMGYQGPLQQGGN